MTAVPCVAREASPASVTTRVLPTKCVTHAIADTPDESSPHFASSGRLAVAVRGGRTVVAQRA